MRTPLLIFAAQLLCACASMPASRPLFDTFKTICADTGARPDAVIAAVEAAGGVRRNPISGVPTDLMVSIHWDFPGPGNMSVASTTMRDPGSPTRPELDTEECSVTLSAGDETGIAAIQKWIGLDPEFVQDSPGVVAYHYSFRDEGVGHMAVPKDSAAYVAAEDKGQIWTMVLVRSASFSSVNYTHIKRWAVPQ